MRRRGRRGASCAVTPWIPATFASATISTGPSPGTSSSRRSSAPIRTSIPAAASTTPSASRALASRGVLVDREPRAVERVERLLVDRERPPTLARPRPGGRGVDVEQHREGTPLQDRARRLGQHRAAAESDHGGLGAFEDGCCNPLLDHPEPGLAVAREELLDRGAGLPLDLVIEIDEGAAEATGDLLARGSSCPRP